MIQYDRRDEWRGQPETVATATSDRNGLNSLAFVGRQAIYNSALTVIAYELLYRALPEAADAQITDSRQATLHVLANAVLEIGLDRLAGGVPVHINYPRELLASDEPPSLQPDRVVIEIAGHTSHLYTLKPVELGVSRKAGSNDRCARGGT